MNPLKPWLISGALMLGVGAVGIGTAVKPGACVPETSPWLSSFETAKTIARQGGKPIFLVFR